MMKKGLYPLAIFLRKGGNTTMLQISLPQTVREVLDRLNAAGQEAYVVGGCVRDRLLGREPADWDIATSALPDETRRIFADRSVIDTGIRHGTVSVLLDGQPLEITTYRIESAYSDHRHPDTVSFTRSLREDLRRRDFTINAMAYHPIDGLQDFFGGQADLKARIVRCVGDPRQRFEEDALRIVRALRFASVLGCSIDGATKTALLEQAPSLSQIAVERVAHELQRLLCGDHVLPILMDYAAVLTVILPELGPMIGHPQPNPYHRYTVYEHTARTVQAIPPSPARRWTMLLHDSGKPSCYSVDEQGIGHFYGHPAVSVQIARTVLNRLKMDTATIDQVLTLVQFHDHAISDSAPSIRRWLHRVGPDRLMDLLEVKRADICGQNPDLLGRLREIDALSDHVRRLIEQNTCYSLRDLAVNGRDLMDLGVSPGPMLGQLLEDLLEAVIEEACPNEKAALLELASSWLHANNAAPAVNEPFSPEEAAQPNRQVP